MTPTMNRTQRNLIALGTLARKETQRFLRIWQQTLLPPVITMTLYLIIFGSLIGSRIGPMEGYPYIQFIVPGIIMMAVITNSYSNVVSSFFGAKFGRYVEEMLVSSMPNYVLLLGYVIGGVGRGLLVGLLVIGVSLFFTDLHLHSFWITCSTILLTSVLFSLGGFINAIFARKFDDISIIPTFVLTPLTYLGGVFYSIDLLPEWARQVSMANPILHMVNAFRYGFLGTSDVSVPGAFAIMIGCAVALYVWVKMLLDRGAGIRD